MANQQPDLRIGDAEREDATQLLTGHLEAGRLDHDEFAQRVQRALGATHDSQLGELFRDLPGRRPGTAARLPVAAPPRPERRIGPPPIAWWAGTTLLAFVAASTMLGAVAGGHGRPGRHGGLGPQVAEHAGMALWWLPLLVGLVILIGTVGFFAARRIRQRRRTAG